MARRGVARCTMPCQALVVLLALGVAIMHTFGHPAPSGHSHVGTAAEAAPTTVNHGHAGIEPAAELAATMMCAGGGLHPMSVCLAVLSATGPHVAVAWWPVPASLLPIADALSGAVPGSSRSPPARTMRLRLADLSVLRT